MITYTSTNQLRLETFKTPFELKMPADNRWVKLSSLLPWDDFVRAYVRKLKADRGAPSIDARVAIGSLVIKHKLQLSDRETIETIRENPFIQYFLGLPAYHPEPLFDASLFVHLRNRMGVAEWDELNKDIACQVEGIDFDSGIEEGSLPNKGKLQIDATVADQYIKYPTDLDLLNDSRQWSEGIIDDLYLKGSWQTKPRTYRRVARKDYLTVAKKKKKTKKQIRRGLRKQLNYLRRNFKTIEKMLDSFEGQRFPLSAKLLRYYWVIQEVYRQQRWMYEQKQNRCDDRIVSIHQPHVRPIVRGKSKHPVEFGAKLSLALNNGYARIDRLSWDSYNEAGDLQTQVEAYKSIHGRYPELVQCDRIYGTRENRSWCKQRCIRMTAPPLGRKPKEQPTAHQKRKSKKEANERNQIEGKFGQGKNGYGMNRVRARLRSTSESWIGAIVFVMNLVKLYDQYRY